MCISVYRYIYFVRFRTADLTFISFLPETLLRYLIVIVSSAVDQPLP
jgi:hypothetical protein